LPLQDFQEAMHRINKERGLGLTEDDIVGVFLDADANYDGYIDYQEFCSSFSGELHSNPTLWGIGHLTLPT
jgi:Ca2+-binding EF-hand superfamily protein